MAMNTQIERPGAITFKGDPMTLVGRELKVGDHAPDFQLQAAGAAAPLTWAEQERVDNIRLLSDHKERSFADAYGVRIKELGLLARAVYLVDKGGVIRYIETVAEVASEPDYDAALRAAQAAKLEAVPLPAEADSLSSPLGEVVG